MSEKTIESLKAAARRALWTVSQSAVAAIGTAVYMGEVNWQAVASTALLAGIVSLMKSLSLGMPECEKEG